MKYTLLDMTQTILSSMDSDEVNSISDTPESLQVAYVIRSCYFDIVSRNGLPEHFDVSSLDASGDNLKPVLMSMKSDTSRVSWVKYNTASTEEPEIQMRDIKYVPLTDFLQDMYELDETDTRVGKFIHIVNGTEFPILYLNDKAPQRYTTFDDRTLIFDSYDNTVDTTLQSSKSLVYARKVIPFTMSDNFMPDLDEPQFALLLNESKAMAWLELKQSAHPKAEQNAQRGWVRLQKTQDGVKKTSLFDQLPNYGRK